MKAALIDAGDNWLEIEGESWNTVKQRDYAESLKANKSSYSEQKTKPKAESQENSPIPKGYSCHSSGVKKINDEGDPEWITLKPVLVKALSRDESSNNWGVLVWWKDMDNKEHEIAIPKKLFHAQGTEIAQLLADGGLQIIPGKERSLLQYLAAFNVKNKLIAASSTGWLGDSFILPKESINEPKGQRIVYQPSGLSNISKAITKQPPAKRRVG